jgi:ribosomal protein S18 acetylase RimI-like enzyme
MNDSERWQSRVVDIVPLREHHAEPARLLLLSELGGTPYLELPLRALEGAYSLYDPEYRAFIAVHNDTVVGLILFGQVAGAVRVGKLHLVAVAPSERKTGIAMELIRAAVDDFEAKGTRFMVVEVPDDPALAAGQALLRRCGFHDEARVGDFYRDGVDLLILRMGLTDQM